MSASSVVATLACLGLVACTAVPQAPISAVKVPTAAVATAPPARVEVAAQEPDAPPPSPVKDEIDAPAPTWSAIYARYLAPGTEGGCAAKKACHAEAMHDAASAYAWLAQRGYIAGPASALIGGNSCLRVFGGNMPPRGKIAASAVRDLQAWVAAGAVND